MREAMIMLMSAVLETATSAIAAKIFVSTASGPTCTTSNSRPSKPESITAKATMKVTKRPLERLVGVQRRAGGLRVLRHELGVRAGGERGEDRREQERGSDRAAHAPAHLAHQRVDARP